MKRLWLLLVCTLGLALPASAVDWSAAWENVPANNDSLSDGANQIRIFKDEGRFRAEVGHQWGSVINTDDNGLHHLGAARCFYATAAPTDIVQSDYDNTQAPGASGGGATLLTATETNPSGTNEIGMGRCWVDTDGINTDATDGTYDDWTLNIYDSAAPEWKVSRGEHFTTVPPGHSNLVYNGGFDILNTLATGADGDGWTRVQTPTTLAAADLVEAEDMGDGQGLQIIDTGAALAGVSQTLDGLKGATTYFARVNVIDDTGTCRIATTGGGTNLSATSDDSGTWQTLAGTFVTNTDGTTNVVLQLLAVAQSDDCTFDHVGVYEVGNTAIGRRIPVGRAGIVIEQSCNADAATFNAGGAPVNFSSEGGTDHVITVTPALPNTIIEVWGHASAEASGTAAMFALAIDEAGTDVATGTARGPFVNDDVHIALNWINVNPTPGTSLTYSLQGADGEGTISFPESYASSPACLTVKMTPPY